MQTELSRRERSLIQYTEKIGGIEKEIKEIEAHFVQIELLRFVLSERYVFAPLNFANAAAGLPHLGWRRSFLEPVTKPRLSTTEDSLLQL
jgi:hypothetical protein